MTRLGSIAVLAGTLLAGVVAGPAAAAVPDAASSCAILFADKARQLATVDGRVYPFMWYRVALTPTEVILALVVYGPHGAIRHSGFECHIAPDGSVTISRDHD